MKTMARTITITLEGSPTLRNESTIIQSIKKLLAKIWPNHKISFGFSCEPGEIPKDTAESSLKLEHKFRELAGRKVLEITASGLIKPSEDSAQWEGVEKYLEDLVDGAQAVIVNIANVPHVDAAGLGVLVTFYTFLKRRGIELIFVSPSEKVRQKLNICRLDTVFHIVGNNEVAYHDIANSF